MEIPAHLRYTKDHEWLAIEGDRATVGITDFAQRELGDIVYVELPPVGKTVAAGDVLGTVESVKAVSEIYAPVSGTVLEVNAALSERPEVLNRDPYGEGWVCRLRPRDPSEIEPLLDADRYRSLIGS
jgi:glycine cleavage system H protein